jgi:hypothetical protein
MTSSILTSSSIFLLRGETVPYVAKQLRVFCLRDCFQAFVPPIDYRYGTGPRSSQTTFFP